MDKRKSSTIRRTVCAGLRESSLESFIASRQDEREERGRQAVAA